MSYTQLNNFDAASFLEQYWQQKPLLLSNAISDFSPPLDADELAGLALEPEVESRIIVENKTDKNSGWQLLTGPFDESHYKELDGKNWSLLVQAVDLYVDEIADLKSLFRFIPDWRLDDIMISYAPTGGSVGPHFDQYDVFLLQASGTRRWKLGQFCDDNTALQDNEQLKILQQFDSTDEHVLNAGDILYIPPGVAHWGISESDDCMTISIGFRAPSDSQIIQNSCDEVISCMSEDQRFRDIQIDAQRHSAEIPAHVEAQLKEVITKQLVNSPALIASFGQLMTDCKYPQAAVDQNLNIKSCIENKQLLSKSPDARIAYFIQDAALLLFANGQVIHCSKNDEDFIQSISDNCIDVNHDALSDAQIIIIDALIQLGIYEIYDE